MPFSVQAYIDDHRVLVIAETAKDAFGTALEFSERMSDVTIIDGNTSYTVSEFSSVMALKQIADIVEAEGSTWEDIGPQRILNF